MAIIQLLKNLLRQYGVLTLLLSSIACLYCVALFQVSEAQDENHFFSEQLYTQSSTLNELSVVLLNANTDMRHLRYLKSRLNSVQSSLAAAEKLHALQQSNAIMLQQLQALLDEEPYAKQALLDSFEDVYLQMQAAQKSLTQTRRSHSHIYKVMSLFLPVLIILSLVIFYQYRYKPLYRRISHFYQNEKQAKFLLEKRGQISEALQQNHLNMIYKVGHLMRVSLNSALGMLQIATTESADKDAALAKTTQAILDMQDAINVASEYAELEQGSIVPKARPFCLFSALAEIQHRYLNKLVATPVKFIMQVTPNVPMSLVADEYLLQRVLNHLLDNAIEHTETGKIRVVFTVSEKKSDHLKIQVLDTGTGISARQLEHIKKGQLQLDTDSQVEANATGLGIYTVARIIKLLAGHIEYHSQPGHGTNVILEIPFQQDCERHYLPSLQTDLLVKYKQVQVVTEDLLLWQYYQMLFSKLALTVEQQADCVIEANSDTLYLIDKKCHHHDHFHDTQNVIILASQTRSCSRYLLPRYATLELISTQLDLEPQRSSQTLANKSVLVVEDNDINQEVILAQLSQFKIESQVVANGEEAIAILADEKFDLILMDLNMPKMDGLACTKALRARGLTTPIIALTAHTLRQDEIKCLEAGMNGFLRKPLAPDTLSQTLQHYLM
ncbi:response regulator [Gayadomonas joobiniege]|uniref:ATP-binding response regulator n=1 Tax=Gayadomonas joobiniege TaxID=1234606 RepID=UPI0003782667|nr:response regulator [Gayadomonas joobiniege]